MVAGGSPAHAAALKSEVLSQARAPKLKRCYWSKTLSCGKCMQKVILADVPPPIMPINAETNTDQL